MVATRGPLYHLVLYPGDGIKDITVELKFYKFLLPALTLLTVLVLTKIVIN